MKRVKIKTWEQMEEDFGLTKYGSINCEMKFTKEMERSLPKDRIIETENNGWQDKIRRSESRWWIPEGWWITDDMIEEVIEEER
jgi:hypothetical protein